MDDIVLYESEEESEKPEENQAGDPPKNEEEESSELTNEEEEGDSQASEEEEENPKVPEDGDSKVRDDEKVLRVPQKSLKGLRGERVDNKSSKRVAELLIGAGCTQRLCDTKICSGIGATVQFCVTC